MAYRILTLDGGGNWGLVEVKALQRIFGATAGGHEVLGHFDMAAGCSAGGIVLAGLLKDMRLDEILELFTLERNRRAVFSPTGHPVYRLLKKFGMGPGYSTAGKMDAIRTHLDSGQGLGPVADWRLDELAGRIAGPSGQALHVLIVGFDYDRNRAVFFRSAPGGTGDWGNGAPSRVTIAEAAHASSTAPVLYFDEPAALPAGRRFWDGGITGQNNPVLVALTEAMVLGRDPKDVAVLSLGTGTVALPPAVPGRSPPPGLAAVRANRSLVTAIGKVSAAALDDPPDAASFIAHVIATTAGGGSALPERKEGEPLPSPIVRLSPLIGPVWRQGEWQAPTTGMSEADIAALAVLPMDALDQPDIDRIISYTELWIGDRAPNQPIRADGETHSPEIGYASFGRGLEAWTALTGHLAPPGPPAA